MYQAGKDYKTIHIQRDKGNSRLPFPGMVDQQKRAICVIVHKVSKEHSVAKLVRFTGSKTLLVKNNIVTLLQYAKDLMNKKKL